jgi:hypothetical protein
MMEFISTIVIVLVGLFLLYKTGVMKLIQTSTDAAVRQSGKGLEEWELGNEEARSASYGKMLVRMQDKTIVRSSAEQIRDELEKLVPTEQTTPQT